MPTPRKHRKKHPADFSNEIPNISRWSRNVTAYGMAVGDLDLYLLKEHPQVLRALGRERYPQKKIPDLRTRDHVVALLACFITPIAALTVFTGGYNQNTGQQVDPLSDDLAVPISAACYVIALCGAVWIAIRWWRTRRHWSGAELLTLGATILCGAGVLWGMHQAGLDVLGLSRVTLPVSGTVVLAAVLLLVMAAASQGRRAPLAKHFKVVDEPDVQEAMEVIARMTPARVDELLGKRERAIARLHERGVIDDTERQALEGVPMGLSPTLNR